MEGEPLQPAATPESTPVADASAEVTESGASVAAEGVVTDADTGAPEGTEGTAEAAAPTADDDADLLSYPEAVRGRFKDLKPEERKALYEHAEANAREGLKAVQEREAALKAEQDRKAAQVQEIRAKLGKYTGAEPITRIDRDGVERTYPSLEEALQLNQNPRGRQQAYEKYGLDESDLSAHIDEMRERIQMLDESADHLELVRLVQFDQRLRDGFKDVGLNPDEYLGKVSKPEEIVPALVRALREQHQAEMKAKDDKHASEIRLHTVNAEGLRARALAGDSPPIPTGGRTSGSEHIYTRAELASMSMDEYRRNRETIDRQAAAGLIR